MLKIHENQNIRKKEKVKFKVCINATIKLHFLLNVTATAERLSNFTLLLCALDSKPDIVPSLPCAI